MAAGSQFLKQIAAPALTSGAMATGYSLLMGANPFQALLSGLADTGASALAVGTVRKLRPGSYGTQRIKDLETGLVNTVEKRSKLETPANIVTSLGTSFVTAPLIYGGQQEQIAQQLQQRSVVNQLPMDLQLQSVAPGTMNQVSATQFEQLLNQVSNRSWKDYLDPEDQQLISGILNPQL